MTESLQNHANASAVMYAMGEAISDYKMTGTSAILKYATFAAVEYLRFAAGANYLRKWTMNICNCITLTELSSVGYRAPKGRQ